MTTLAQAIKLPSISGNGQTPIAYPQEFKGFLFQGPQGTIGNVLSNALPIIMGLAGLGLLLMLILGGYDLLTSGGDAKKMETGKQRLTYAIVGFLIIFGAYWAVQIIGTMFGTGITPGFK